MLSVCRQMWSLLVCWVRGGGPGWPSNAFPIRVLGLPTQLPHPAPRIQDKADGGREEK